MSALTLLPHEVMKPRPINDFHALAAAVGRVVPCDELILITTMPRGGLQVCRTLHTGETAARRYAAESHTHDKVAWQALRHDVYDPSDATDGGDSTSLAIGFETTLAVRIDGPVFQGYPGVLIVLRREGREVPAFDAQDSADEIRAAFDTHYRRNDAASRSPRQFIFAGGKSLLPNTDLTALDPKLAQSIEHQLPLFGATDGAPSAMTRFSLPDSTGNCWPVQFVRFESYPALAEGPVIFVSLHPQFGDWEKLDPKIFESDPEVSRLAAAVPFMVQHFRRGPTLEEVASSVHLSQFHFHRRFSEIFGLTPKELLYDLQLNEAKRLLSDPRQQLAEIARHCGFSHQSHFTSRFKQGTGLTPTRWRRVSNSGRA